jgi:hypothetical protein
MESCLPQQQLSKRPWSLATQFAGTGTLTIRFSVGSGLTVLIAAFTEVLKQQAKRQKPSAASYAAWTRQQSEGERLSLEMACLKNAFPLEIAVFQDGDCYRVLSAQGYYR